MTCFKRKDFSNSFKIKPIIKKEKLSVYDPKVGSAVEPQLQQ